MSNNLLDTRTANLLELLGNGKTYRVPAFQREYSWEEEQWEDLWRDLLTVFSNPDERHYMGALVVEGQNDREFLIIDGQQRLATLSILALAVIDRLNHLNESVEDDRNRERAHQLRQMFVGRKDPASLVESSRLSLSNADNGFYQDYLVQLRAPLNPRGLSRSNRLLWECFVYFKKQLQQQAALLPGGEKLALFLSEAAGRQLLFILISVADDLSAYTVFETLNARGVALSTTDLLKNYLFSQLRVPADLEVLQRRWHSLITTVQQERFPDFLRYHMLCSHADVRSQRLFKIVRAEVKSSKQAFELTQDLENRAELYSALLDPSHSYWIDRPAARPYLRELSLFRVRQAIPLLFAAWERLSPVEFIDVLRMVSILTFRYSIVCGLNPSPLEQVYHQTARALMQGEMASTAAVFSGLRSIYVDDEKFATDFSLLELRTGGPSKKLVRYILCKLETDAADKHCDPETDPGTLEHILPENPPDDWENSISRANWDRMVYRLGNLCLLEPSINRRIGNAVYSDKVEAYRKSAYVLTRTIPDEVGEDWTLAAIEQRQDRLARRATHVWRLDY